MPTITTGDEYDRMLELVKNGRLPATIPAEFNGHDGLWTESFDTSRVDFTEEDAGLAAAVVAIRSTYRIARKAGAITRI
jgi:hypothetical protein